MHFAKDSSLIDAAGSHHAPAQGEIRIVSLVPSLTELLCDLGLAREIVGRTGFCVHPRAAVRGIPKVGGTKSVDIARLRELAPTHVLLNIDENEKPTAEAITRFVPHVVVTHPLGPRDNVALYRLLGGIFRCDARAAALVDELERAWTDAGRSCAAFPRENVLYLIWKKPWMTVARDTYIARMLATVGWETVPRESAVRYPEVAIETAFAESARHVLLSTEPYRFRRHDIAELQRALPPNIRVSLIDGAMVSWYGSRAIAGLRYLTDFRRRLLAEKTVE